MSVRDTQRRVGRTRARLMAAALGVGLLFGGAGLASAQQSDAPEKRQHHKKGAWKNMTEKKKMKYKKRSVDERLEKMTERLELTKTQQEDVREILEEAKSERKKLKGQKKKDRKQFKQLRKDTREKIGMVLTEEQKEKAKAHRKERREKRFERRLDRLDEALELTDAQRPKVETILRDAREDVHEVFEASESKKQAREQVRAIRKKADADLAAVLDESQLAKYNEFREKKRDRKGKHKHKRGF